jgi:sugar phosphate isomerase/epimerase
MTNIIALQLYTVRDETAKDFKGTLRAVAEIGYHGVEFAGYGGLDSQELAALLSEYGLKTVGSHVGLALL